MTIDDTDRDIIEALEDDGRATYQDISARVGLSGPAVSQRVERLLDRGVIQGFSVDVDQSKLNPGSLTFLSFRPQAQTPEALHSDIESAEVTDSAWLLDDGRVLALVWIEAGGALEFISEHTNIESIEIESVTAVSSPL